MTDSEVLSAAADLIERCGLHKGEYWPGDDDDREYEFGDPCCALGAIRLIVFSENARHSAAMKLAKVVDCVSEWNDRSTQAEVVATLRAVAAS